MATNNSMNNNIPDNSLNVSGDIDFHGNLGFDANALFINIDAGEIVMNFRNANINIGVGAGNLSNAGNNNINIGSGANNSANNTSNNIAIGQGVLGSFFPGGGDDHHTVIGYAALQLLLSGAVNNIALGYFAGRALTGTESNNIDIGSQGVAGDNGVTRIGTNGTHTSAFMTGIFGTTVGVSGVPVVVDNNDQLGTVVSSIKFKENVVDMGDESSVLMKLRPVMFNLKRDASKHKQWGLIAEEVKEVYPELVVTTPDGEPHSVRYMDLIPMLLNEHQKMKKELDELKQLINKK